MRNWVEYETFEKHKTQNRADRTTSSSGSNRNRKPNNQASVLLTLGHEHLTCLSQTKQRSQRNHLQVKQNTVPQRRPRGQPDKMRLLMSQPKSPHCLKMVDNKNSRNVI